MRPVHLADVELMQSRGYGEGTMDRMAGKKDSIVGAITGDKAQQTSGAYFVASTVSPHSPVAARRQRAEREGPGEAGNEQVIL